jgi:hypothetical protein
MVKISTLSKLLSLAFMLFSIDCLPNAVICDCSSRIIDPRCPTLDCRSSESTSNQHIRALIISTDTAFYPDVAQLREMLPSEIGSCVDTRVLTKTNTDPEKQPTKENIKHALNWLACGDKPNNEEAGLSVLYMSSHGKRIEETPGNFVSYLIASSAEDGGSVRGNLLGSKELLEIPLRLMDEKCPQRQYLVILDSCHSGGLLAGLPLFGQCTGPADLYSRLRVITSSRADQLSGLSSQSSSLFTKSLRNALTRTPRDRTITDILISTRAILREDSTWSIHSQEPSMFACANNQQLPFLGSSMPANLQDGVSPIAVAFRRWEKDRMYLETDHCAKLGTDTKLKPSSSSYDGTIFRVKASAKSPFSSQCMVAVDSVRVTKILNSNGDKIRTTNRPPNFEEKSQVLEPGTLLIPTGARSLENSVIVDVPQGGGAKNSGIANDLLSSISDGARDIRELTLRIKGKVEDDARNRGYYQLKTTTVNVPESGLKDFVQWARVIPEKISPSDPLQSTQCESMLPLQTPLRENSLSSRISLLRDAINLYKLNFWQNVAAPEQSSSFPAMLALYGQGELIGHSRSSNRCLSVTPGKYTLRLLSAEQGQGRSIRKRFVYLCMMSRYASNKDNDSVPAAIMLYPNNNRQDQESVTLQVASPANTLGTLDLKAGDSKLLVLLTSPTPRSQDLCRQGPIPFIDRHNTVSPGRSYDLSLDISEEQLLLLGSMVVQPEPLSVDRLTPPPVGGLSVRPSSFAAGDDEETVQRLWVTVR